MEKSGYRKFVEAHRQPLCISPSDVQSYLVGSEQRYKIAEIQPLREPSWMTAGQRGSAAGGELDASEREPGTATASNIRGRASR